MTQQKDKGEFEQWVRGQLDTGHEGIDGATQTRLRAMRKEAVARAANADTGLGQWRDVLVLPAWQWAGVMMAMLVLGLLVIQLARSPAHDLAGGIEDAALLSAAEEMEFFQELEFYGWLYETKQAS